MRRVGLVVRVSTERQAENEEGSLKNQLQRLRQHIDYRRSVAGEEWIEAAVYELRAVSGKDSLRSAEFERLFGDVRSGRINTILCPALDRVSRSVKHFLHFFEFINEHNVEFVCLKQNYDTTTPQGRLFVTIMMALAEFEREQTSERTHEATTARAERGLWNGGRLLGYDLDPDKKGSLVPNPEEALLVNFAFDSYLECGSLKNTAQALNRHGYRTKAYTSRRDKYHPGSEFTITSVQYFLKNPAYLAKKEINKKAKERGVENDGYRLVDAMWPAIVDEEKFEQARRLMTANRRSNHNGSRPARHIYLLSGGLLHCGRCGSPMEDRSGTGRLGVKYFYYACRRHRCGLRVVASEIEDAALGRLREMARDGALVERLVRETNGRMDREKRALQKRLQGLRRALAEVKAEADTLMSGWPASDSNGARTFLMERLDELAQRRRDLEQGIEEAEWSLGRLESEQVSADTIRAALGRFNEVYAQLTPFERKELVRLILHRAEVSDRQIVLELYPIAAPKMAVAQSVLKDVSAIRLPSLSRWIRKARRRFHKAPRAQWRDNASLYGASSPPRVTVPKLGC